MHRAEEVEPAREPAGSILCNGQPRPLQPGTTVARLLEQLRLDPRRVAVEVNRELVPRARHAQHTLCSGDVVEIVTLVGGG